MTLDENTDYTEGDQQQRKNEPWPPRRWTYPEDATHNKERKRYKGEWTNKKCRAVKIPRRQKIEAERKDAAHKNEYETDSAMSYQSR